MDMFTLPFAHPAEFFISLAIGGGFVYIFQKAAMSSEQRETPWVRRFVTGPNGKMLWGGAWLVWAVGFGLLLGMIVSPIVLGIIFFGLFTPIATLMRLSGRDELKLKFTQKVSHWIPRNDPINSKSFKYQF